MNNIKKYTYIIVFSLLLPVSVLADAGDEAYRQGQALERGTGNTEQNKTHAAEAFQKAVDAGHLRAHNNLAMMYLNGEGVSQDAAKARELFRAAAEGGLDNAQYQLAEMLRKGIGGDKNIDAALKWYQRAADQGHIGAMAKLGSLYASDKHGVKADYPRAYAWYLLAKQHGGFVSTGKLNLVERRMNPDGMDKAKKLVEQLAPSESQG